MSSKSALLVFVEFRHFSHDGIEKTAKTRRVYSRVNKVASQISKGFKDSALLVLVAFRNLKWIWKLTKYTRLILVVFSIPSWLTWRNSTKTRRADFEDIRNRTRRLRCSRLSRSCFGRFSLLCDPKWRNATKTTGQNSNTCEIYPSRFGRLFASKLTYSDQHETGRLLASMFT